MAETTTTATAEQPSLHKYYWSTDDKPFAPTWVPFELAGDSYPLVVSEPDPTFKSPKYDWRNRVWVDNVAETVFDKVNKVSDSVKTLSTRVDNMAQEQANAVKADAANDKKMDQMLKLITMTNAQLGSLFSKFNTSATAENNKSASIQTTAGITNPGDVSTTPKTDETSPTTASNSEVSAKEGE